MVFVYVLLHYVSFLVSYNVTLVNCVASRNYTKCNGTGTSRSVTLSLNLDKIFQPGSGGRTTQSSSTTTQSPQPAPIEVIKNLVRTETCMLCLFCTVINKYLQTKENPTAGLLKYLEQQQEGYSIAQLQDVLQIAYNEQPRENINETFVKVESGNCVVLLWKFPQ